jgi:hypothetical protein
MHGRPAPVTPQLRSIRGAGREIPVGNLVVVALPAQLSALQEQLDELVVLVMGEPGDRIMPVFFAVAEVEPEGYELDIDHEAIHIRAGTSLGALHAMRTLVDLWDCSGHVALPEVQIVDHPSFSTRGVFVESFAGTDLMDLSDWKLFLDRMGQLKFNTVGVSIYGCWDIHHEGERSEYLFTPLEDFPELRSPQRMVTWDPASEREVEYRYLPRMFEDDFFGELVRYAADRGIELIPHLGGPGHSTLIPRVIPELSALDEEGEPTGYGHCVSQPRARDALARLVRCLARQHLVPNGVRRLHVAGDEYYPIRNIDPQDRKRIVSPYCRCAGCRDLTPGEMLIEYLVQVGQVLAAEGVTMIHWQDTLVREEVLDAYLDRVEALGLPKPVIAWWKYNDPVPTPDAARAETWSCPTTGLASFLFQQDFSPNIESTLRRGHQAGVTGAFAYGSADPADHENYAVLADLSWNLEGSGGASGFRRRWARRICRNEDETAYQALSLASTITACYPLMMYVIHHVLPFFSTATGGATTYPDDLLRAFALAQPPLTEVLRQAVETVRDAASLMPEGADDRYWPNPATAWRQEIGRLADSLDLFVNVLAAVRRPAASDEEALHRQADALLRLVAASKPAYLAPAALREHWGFVREIQPVVKRLREGNGMPASEPWYPWLI